MVRKEKRVCKSDFCWFILETAVFRIMSRVWLNILIRFVFLWMIWYLEGNLGNYIFWYLIFS